MSRKRPLRWPNGARLAVLPQLIFELWQGKVEAKTTPAVSRDDFERGLVDYSGNAWAGYGIAVGAARVQRLYDAYGVPATGIFSGAIADLVPDFVRGWAAAGHEIAAHSFYQDIRIFCLDENAERENIQRCRDAIERVTGHRPVGWNSPAGQRSDNTTRLLLEEGFFYSYDYKDDDQPHTAEEIGGRRMIAVPKLFDVNDVTIYSMLGHPPAVFVETFIHSFDSLYEEGERDGKMISLSGHAAMFGRPFGVSALEECLRYARSFPNVWFATGQQVAEWWRETGGDEISYPDGK